MLSLAVLASGNGSNLKAIYHAIRSELLSARIKLVLSNNSQCGALRFAHENGIPAVHHSSVTCPDPRIFEENLSSIFQENEVDFIVLAGYMKLLPLKVIQAFRNKISNIHPALLPSFGGKGMYGIHVHEAVIESGARFTGATVHLVDEIYDHGTIVLQKVISVQDDDTPESLAARVLDIEHQLYPEALQLISEDRIQIINKRVRIL